MNLGKHIQTLLKRQTEVHVPGLGSFKRVYNPATFDSERNVLLPPVSYIEFDSLSTAGYDFVSYVQQVNRLDRHPAESMVADQVAAVKADLDLSGEANLDGLGQLVSYGNTAIFKPLDLSGFNLQPIETIIPHDNPVVDEEQVEAGAEATQGEEEEELTVLPPVLVEDEPSTESEEATAVDTVDSNGDAYAGEEDEPSRNRSSLYVMVALLALLSLGGLYYFTQYKNIRTNSNPTIASNPTDSVEEQVIVGAAVDTTTLEAAVDTLAAELQSDTISTVAELSQEVTAAPQEEHKKFTIVIGTHRALAKAHEEAEAFHKEGHHSVRVVTPNLAKNLKRVIWDTYATKAERDSALKYVRKHIKTDAWPDVLK